MKLKKLTVGGTVEGSGSRTPISIEVTGPVDIQSGGYIGGRTTGAGTKGKGVDIRGGSTVTVGGTVAGDKGSARVDGKDGVTVSSGGSITSTKSTTLVRSTNGPVTVAGGGSISGRRDVATQAGSGHRTTVNGDITSTGGNVLINPSVTNPGSVVVNGQICAAKEVYIKADTLFINGTIKCRTFQKKAKFVFFGPLGKVTGPTAAEKNIRAKDKVLTQEDLDNRPGTDPALDSDSPTIVGGPASIISMRNAPLAISATVDVTIATGIGGTLDLRENPPGTNVVESTGPITLRCDTILLDPGVVLTDLMGPGPVLQFPSGDQASVTTLSAETGVAYAGQTVDVSFLVSNMGNVDDTYTIAVTDSAGWGFTQSDVMVMLPAFGETDSLITITLDVPPGAVAGADSNKVGVDVVSTFDPSVSYSEDTIVPVNPDSDFYYGSLSWWGTEHEQPGEVSSVEFILRNEGDLTDTYSIVVTDSLG
jgi:hypothetical protein